jgi:predicted enzyme related to lactoylglutathione lyase
VDATAQKAASLGAKTFVPPMDIPGTGRFAVFADPQGAPFAIVTFAKM